MICGAMSEPLVYLVATLPWVEPGQTERARPWLTVERAVEDQVYGYRIAERSRRDHGSPDDPAIFLARESALELAQTLAEAEAGARPYVEEAPGAVTPANITHLADLPKGWAIMFIELLSELPPGYAIDWAAQKFGEMRCSPTGEHESIFSRYEERSRRTCALCGAPGRMMQSGGVYRPHCLPCAVAEGFGDPTQGTDA